MEMSEYIQVITSYMDTFLKKITTRYQDQENRAEFNPDQGNHTEFNPNPEKIPVWICWWQGEENAPEIIKTCIRSIRKHMPKDRTEIIMITFENFMHYVEFPPYIIEKYNKGIISMTHLSDVLRAKLLSERGGMWLDATYFMSRDLPASFFDQDFFTQKFESPLWDDVVKSRWSINLLMGKRGNVVFDFWKDSLLFYWERHDTLLDYFITDYIWAVGYNNLVPVRQQIDHCPPSNAHVFELRELINDTFEKERYNELIKDTYFFKLSYKTCYRIYDEDGNYTFYGEMVNHRI